MRDLGSELDSLVDAARTGDDPTDDDRARVRRALLLRLGGVAAGTAVAASTSTAAAGASTASVAAAVGGGTAAVATGSLVGVALKAVAALVLVGGVGVSAVAYTRANAPAAVDARQSAVTTVPAARRSAAPIAPALVSPARAATPVVAPLEVARVAASVEPASEGIAPRRPPPGAPVARPRANVTTTAASTPDALQGEVALLRAAEQARRAGQADHALALLDQHRTRYPNGVLREEQRALRVRALCDLGRIDDARAEAARFLGEAPNSPLAATVRRTCAGTP